MKPFPKVHLLHLATSVLATISFPLNLKTFFKLIPQRGEQWQSQSDALAFTGSLLLGSVVCVLCILELRRCGVAMKTLLLPFDRMFYEVRWMTAAIGTLAAAVWWLACVGTVVIRLA